MNDIDEAVKAAALAACKAAYNVTPSDVGGMAGAMVKALEERGVGVVSTHAMTPAMEKAWTDADTYRSAWPAAMAARPIPSCMHEPPLDKLQREGQESDGLNARLIAAARMGELDAKAGFEQGKPWSLWHCDGCDANGYGEDKGCLSHARDCDLAHVREVLGTKDDAATNMPKPRHLSEIEAKLLAIDGRLDVVGDEMDGRYDREKETDRAIVELDRRLRDIESSHGSVLKDIETSLQTAHDDLRALLTPSSEVSGALRRAVGALPGEHMFLALARYIGDMGQDLQQLNSRLLRIERQNPVAGTRFTAGTWQKDEYHDPS